MVVIMFKPGDKVRRINDNHGIAIVGSIYTVKTILDGGKNLNIKEDNNGWRTYMAKNFELVKPKVKRTIQWL